MSAYSPLLAAAPADFVLTVVDAGAVGGLHARWRAFRPLVAGALFDPREPADGGARPVAGAETVFPCGLAAADGEATLHVTALGNMSSTLRPNQSLMNRFRKKKGHAEVVDEERFPVRALDAIAQEAGFAPDVLKADVQGGEARVLDGARRALETSILFVEIEVSFLERYENQPRFADIEARLAAHGFELIDLYRLKRYRHENAAGLGNLSLGGGQRAGRLAYGDAFFLLREDVAGTRAEAMRDEECAAFVLKAIITLLAYGKADLAARWFDLYKEKLNETMQRGLEKSFAALGRRRYGPGHLHHLFDYVGRKL